MNVSRLSGTQSVMGVSVVILSPSSSALDATQSR